MYTTEENKQYNQNYREKFSVNATNRSLAFVNSNDSSQPVIYQQKMEGESEIFMEMELTHREVHSQHRREQNFQDVDMHRYISAPMMHQRQTEDLNSVIRTQNLCR